MLPAPSGTVNLQPFAFEWESGDDSAQSSGTPFAATPTPVTTKTFYSWGFPLTPDLRIGSLVIYHQMTIEAGTYQQANGRALGLRRLIEEAFFVGGSIAMPALPTYVHEISFLMLEREIDGDARVTVAAPGTAFTMFDLELNGDAGYATLGTSSVMTNQDGDWVLAETILDASDINLSTTTLFENTFRVAYQTDRLPRMFEESRVLSVTP